MLERKRCSSDHTPPIGWHLCTRKTTFPTFYHLGNLILTTTSYRGVWPTASFHVFANSIFLRTYDPPPKRLRLMSRPSNPPPSVVVVCLECCRLVFLLSGSRYYDDPVRIVMRNLYVSVPRCPLVSRFIIPPSRPVGQSTQRGRGALTVYIYETTRNGRTSRTSISPRRNRISRGLSLLRINRRRRLNWWGSDSISFYMIINRGAVTLEDRCG